MFEYENEGSTLSRILAAGRTRVVRTLSRAVGMQQGSHCTLQLGDLEQRVLYSATPVPVPVEADTCVVCEAPEAPHEDAALAGSQLVLVDASTGDYQSLVEGLSDSSAGHFEVMLLAADKDGIEQITEILSDRTDLSAIHIVSHGSAGQVRLGSAVLNGDSLAAYSGMLGEWHSALTHDADILFYGCDLAASGDGRDLVNALSILTGADVAASDDLTGHGEFGGDWDLEVDTGDIEADVAFTELARSAWLGTLSSPPAFEIHSGATTVAGTSVWVAASGFDLTAGSSDLEATFSVDQGTLTIADATDVDLVAGDLIASQSMTITGSVVSVEQAMANLIFTADAGFTGTVEFTATIDDLSGGLASDKISISVVEPFSVDERLVIAGSGDDESSRGERRGVTRSVSLLPDGTSVVALTNSVSGLSTFTVVNPDGSTRSTGSIGSNNARHVSVATDVSDPAGSFVAVWTEGGGNDDVINIQRFNLDGTPSAAVARSPIAGLVERNPSIDMNRNGDYAVVWESGGGNVRIQRFDNQDQPIDSMAVPIPNSNGGENPAIGIDANRNVVVSWDDAVAQYYTRFDGVSFTAGTLSTAASAGGSAIAMNDAGQAVIAWHEQGWDVFAQKIDGNGLLVDTPFAVPESTNGDQLNPSVSMDESGNFAISWEGQNSIRMRRFAWDGTAGSQVRIDADSLFNDNASIAMLDQHNYMVVYGESNGDTDVLSRRFTLAPTFTERPEVVLSAAEIVSDDGVTVNVDAFVPDADSVAGSAALSFASSRPDIVDATSIVAVGSGRLQTLSIPIIAGARGTATIDVTATDPDGNTRTLSVDIVVPTDITVTTAADELDGDVSSLAALYANPGGSGVSLREAITAANNTSNQGVTDRIVFDLPAGDVMNVATSLPFITETIDIDATTASTPVVLDGNGVLAAGLTISDSADGSSIAGLVIRDFGHAGIHIMAESNSNTIRSNRLGSFNNDGEATIGEGNTDGGVFIEGSGNIIGGTSDAHRNIIGGNGVYGVQISGSVNGNLISKNWFGTSETGDAHVEQTQDGIRIIGSATGTSILDNRIRDHREYGISIFNTVSGTSIQSNRIIGNSFGGVQLYDQVTGTEIGGSAADGNTISWNGGAGISASGGTSGNEFRGNRILNNAGLGIDLSDDGSVQINDPLDVDAGANNSQNFPTLFSGTIDGQDLTVAGEVRSVANSIITIDVYVSDMADPTGYGEAERYLGAIAVTTDSSGVAPFNRTFTNVSVTGGAVVTSTATDSGGNTSEFSQNVVARYSAANVAPVNVGPAYSRIAVDEVLRFSAETGNRIRVSDSDAGLGQVQVELMVDRGVLSLGSTSSVGFTIGDGLADDHIVMTGTLEDLNRALEGLEYTPESGFGGEVLFSINTDDLASSGTGGALVDSDVLSIQVGQELGSANRIRANTSTSGDQITGPAGGSAAAILPDGSYVIVWTDEVADGNGGGGVYARILNPDGTEKVSEFRVASGIDGDQRGASVVADSSGRFAVVWTNDPGGVRGVYFRRFSTLGVPIDAAEVRVNTSPADPSNDPHLAVNRDGAGVIVWEGPGSSAGHGVNARQFDMSTGLVGPAFRVNAADTGDENDARVAINDSGDYVVTFERSGEVWAKQFPSGDRSQTAYKVGDGSEATVAIAENGDFLVAYRFNSSIDFVRVRPVSSSGIVGVPVDADPAGSARRPDLASDGVGGYLLVYEENLFLFSVAHYRRIVASGSTIDWMGSSSLLDADGFARNVSVAMSDAGNAVAAWTRDATDGSDDVLTTSFGSIEPNAVFLSTNGSGSVGPLNYTNDELLSLTGGTLALESPTTTGEFLAFGDIGPVFDTDPNLTGFHYVTDEFVVGTDNAFGSIQKGDWLVAIGENSSFAGSGISVQKNDIVLLRPMVGGGQVTVLFDGIADPLLPGMGIQAFTLVEKDTWVGDTLLTAGSLLFTPDTAGSTSNIYVWHNEGVGGGTAGYAELLIDGADIGLTQPITAIELAEDSIDIGGKVIGRGALALSTAAYDGNFLVSGEDVFVFNPTATTLGSGTAAGDSFLLLDGDDIGLAGSEGSFDALSIVGEVRNHAPELTATNRTLGTMEKDESSTPESVNSIVSASAYDPDNDSLGMAITGWSGNGTLEYRLIGNSTWSSVGTVSESSALLLGPDYELRYRPDGSNAEVADLSFRAWDLVEHSELTLVNTTSNGGESAFSSAIETVFLEVTEISFAPTVSLSAGSGMVAENTAGSIKVADIEVVEDGLRVTNVYLQGSDAGAFSVFNTGASLELHFVGGSPDFESKNRYQVTVVVEDSIYGVSDSADFTLSVQDVNEAPTLEVYQFTLAIPEQGLTASPLAIADVLVKDDALGTNNVSVGGADGSFFEVVGSSLVLRANVDVDYETRQFFDVVLQLDDPSLNGGAPEDSFSLRLNISDVNDTAPVVNSSSFTLDEDRSPGAFGVISATDEDTVGTLSDWRIENGTDAGIFSIDASTGHISLGPGALDFESTESYSVEVTVFDGVQRSAISTINITVNDIDDTAPVVTAGQVLSIKEDAGVSDSAGFVVATDEDTPAASLWNWTIETGNVDGVFQIASGTGEITVADNSLLDFESRSFYVLQISVFDGTQVSLHTDVRINVEDANDEVPVIAAGQSFFVDETAPSGQSVGFISASDNDTPIAGLTDWRIESGAAGIFDIRGNGEIYIADPTSLDYETTTSYSMQVSVSDGVSRSLFTTVTVDVIDQPEAPPVAYASTFSVSENEVAGFEIGTLVATYPSGPPATRVWNLQDGFGLFSLSPSGRLSLLGSPDFEAQDSYELIVTVSDGVVTSLPVTITVNVQNENDNDPVIQPGQVMSVVENVGAASLVGTVAASDADGDAVSGFTIIGGNTNDVFEIDPDSGQITVARPEFLDYEVQTSYSLTIGASDGVRTTAANVVVEVMDVVAETSVSGLVFEDLDVDGIAGANTAVSNAVVYLYLDNGDGVADDGDTLLRTTATGASGYSFDGLAKGTYFIVVDSRTILSTVGSVSGDVWAEQTWGSKGSLRRNQELVEDGFVIGGRRVAQSDDASKLSTAEHVTRVSLDGDTESGVDFGFSFDVVTNTYGGNATDHDSSSERTVQGSLRQFILNANAISGANQMRFTPASRPKQEVNGHSWWRISVTSELPKITDADTTIDGTIHNPAGLIQLDDLSRIALGSDMVVGPGADGLFGTGDEVWVNQFDAPLLEIYRNPSASDVPVGLELAGDSGVIRRIGVYGFGDKNDSDSANVKVTGDKALIEGAVIGGPVGTQTTPASNELSPMHNVYTDGASDGVLIDSVVVFAGGTAVELDYDSDGWTISGNRFVLNGMSSGTDGAIDIQRGSGDATITGNFISQSGGTAIDMSGGEGGNFISNNRIQESGRQNTEGAGIRLWGQGNTVESNWLIGNKPADGSPGASIVVVGEHSPAGASTSNTISRNYFENTGGPSIDLVAAGQSPSTNLSGDGLSPNPGYETGAANDGVDAPQITVATIGGNGETVIVGQTLPNSAVELYSAAEDGVGLSYLGSVTSNASGDFSVAGFDVRGALAVTATVTDGAGNTSEFGAARVVNARPVIVANSEYFVNENESQVADLEAKDNSVPVQTLDWNVIGGADAAAFNIDSNGLLSFISPPDFESPKDADGDNVYRVVVKVIDSEGAASSKLLSVVILPVNEFSPVFTSATSVSITEADVDVLDVMATDADYPQGSLSYSLSGGKDLDLFEIDSTSGELRLLSPLDFDRPVNASNVYEVEVSATDTGGLRVSKLISVSVTDLNDEAPEIVDQAFSIAEELQGISLVGNIEAVDIDTVGGPLSYSLISDADGRFEIDSVTGALRARSFDFETESDFSLRIRVSDGENVSLSTVVVSVMDINEVPTLLELSGSKVTENQQGAVVGALSVKDVDFGDQHAWAVSDDRFEIIAGILKLRGEVALDYENIVDGRLELTVSVTDSGGLSDVMNVEVLVQDEFVRILQATTRVVEEDSGVVVWDLRSMLQTNIASEDIQFELVNTSELDAAMGSVSLEDGQLTYESSRDKFGRETFEIRAFSQTESSTADLRLDVNAVNDAPVGKRLEVSLAPGEELRINPLDSNLVVDVDSKELFVVADSVSEGGVLNLDGSVSYVPGPGAAGAREFTYQVSDEAGLMGTVKVEVQIAVAAPLPATESRGSRDAGTEAATELGRGLQEAATVDRTSNIDATDSNASESIESLAEAAVVVEPNVAAGNIDAPVGTLSSPEADSKQQSDFRSVFDPLLQSREGLGEHAELVASLIPLRSSNVAESESDRRNFRGDSTGLGPQDNSGSYETYQQVVGRFAADDRPLRQQFSTQLEEALDHVTQDLEREHKADEVALTAASGIFGGFSVGYLLWLLRGGSLVASMLTSIPAWRMVDPLPIMDFLEGSDDDEDSLDALIERNQKLLERDSPSQDQEG